MSLRERNYTVTLLCEVTCTVKTYDDINAEQEAVARHPYLKAVQARIQYRDGGQRQDTGFYKITPPRKRKQSAEEFERDWEARHHTKEDNGRAERAEGRPQ